MRKDCQYAYCKRIVKGVKRFAVKGGCAIVP